MPGGAGPAAGPFPVNLAENTMRNYGQRLCPRCGQHCPCHYAGRVCPITDEIRAALARFAAEHGPRWKAALCKEWERACAGIGDLDERSLLQQARNILGPSRLYKISLPRPAKPEVAS